MLFFTRRTMENVDTKDLELLKMLHLKNAMPLFSDGRFDHLALAFVNVSITFVSPSTPPCPHRGLDSWSEENVYGL